MPEGLEGIGVVHIVENAKGADYSPVNKPDCEFQ